MLTIIGSQIQAIRDPAPTYESGLLSSFGRPRYPLRYDPLSDQTHRLRRPPRHLQGDQGVTGDNTRYIGSFLEERDAGVVCRIDIVGEVLKSLAPADNAVIIDV